MVTEEKVFRLGRTVFVIEGINYYKLDFHPGRNNIFDIYARLLTNTDSILHFSKSCKVGCKLYKCTVFLHGTNNSGNCFSDFKGADILLPGSQQFFVSKTYSAAVDAFYCRSDIHAYGKSFSRMIYPGN